MKSKNHFQMTLWDDSPTEHTSTPTNSAEADGVFITGEIEALDILQPMSGHNGASVHPESEVNSPRIFSSLS